MIGKVRRDRSHKKGNGSAGPVGVSKKKAKWMGTIVGDGKGFQCLVRNGRIKVFVLLSRARG